MSDRTLTRGMVSQESCEQGQVARHETPRVSHNHGACHREIEMLREEVEYLKACLKARQSNFRPER